MNISDKDLLKKFVSSFDYDKILAKYDIENNIAYLKNLVEINVVNKKDAKKILGLLTNLKKNLPKILESEDIHFAVEKTLENNLKNKSKSLAGIIRTARSRNDLVVSDERLYLKEEIELIIHLIKETILAIINLAEKNLDIIMCGNTHLQPAQPVLFSHYILSFAWMLERDIERLKDCYIRVNVSVLGCAAFAGTTFNIDRIKIANYLGFKNVSQNSVDSVSDRDFIIEFISCCSVLMIHLSRICEEFILWLNPNFGYIELPKELTTGSSIMPQKQNPDYLELIRGKSAKVIGNLVSILTLMKGLPLTYNRDMQEDKIYLFNSVDETKNSLKVINKIFKELRLNKKKLLQSLKFDYILATEFANFLVNKFKIEFKSAHKIVNNCVNYCKEKEIRLTSMNIEEYNKLLSPIKIDKKIFNELKVRLDFGNIVNSTNSFGGTSVKQVKVQIKNLKKMLKSL